MEEEGLISTNEATERYATAPASVAGTAPTASVPVMKASAVSAPAASETAETAASVPIAAVVPNENGAVPTNEEQEDGQTEGTLAGAPQFARTYKDVIEDAKSTKTFTALEQAQRQALAAKTEKQVQYSRVLADTARQMVEDGVSPEDVDFSEKQAYRVLSLYAYATDNQGILFDDETRRTFLGEADAVKAAKAIMAQEMRKQAGTLSARTAIESGTEEERVEALNKFYHGDDEYAYEPQFSLEAAKNALLLMDDRAKVFGLEAALSGLGGRDVAVAAALALPSVPAETKTALLKSLGDADKMRDAANMAVAIRDVAKMNDRGLSGVAADFSLQGLTDIANDWVFVGKALMSLASEYSVYTAAEQYAYDHMPQGYEGTAKEFLESLPDSELSKIEGFTTRDDFFAAYDTGETRANDLLAWLDAQELSSPNYSGGVPDYLGTTLEMISRMSPEILGGIIGGMVSGALGSGTGPGALVTATAGAAVGSIATAAAKRALALNFRKAARTLLRKRARAAAKRAYERKAATQLLPAKLAKWSMPGALTLDMGMSQARELNAQSIREGWNMSEQERLLSTLLVAWSGGLVEKAQWALGIGHLRKWAGAAISGKTLAQRLASVSDRSLMNKAATGFSAWLLGAALEVGAEGLEEGIQEAELQATRLGLSLAGTRTRTGEDVFDANDALKSIITNAGLGLYYAPGLVLPFSGVAGLRRATSGLITRDRTSGEYVRSSFLTADQDLINAQAESEAIWQAAQQKMDEVLVVRAMAIDDEGARTAFYDEQGWNDSQRAAVERAVLYRNIRREYLEGQQKAQERQQRAKKRPATVSSSNINNANNVLGKKKEEKKKEEKKDEEKKDEEKKPDPDKMPLVKKGKGATHWAHVLAAWMMFPSENRRPIDEVRWQIQNTDEAQPLSDEETRVRTREAITAMLCGSEHAYETLATSKSNIALLDAVRAVAEDLLAIEGGKDAARLSIFRELTAALACRVAEKEGAAAPDYNTSPGVESFWGALDLAVPQTTKELPKFDPSVVDEIRDGLVKARETADPSSKEAVDSEAYILRHIFGRYVAAIRARTDSAAPFEAAATFRAGVEWTLTHVKNVRLARNSTAEVLARIIEAANNGDKAAQALVARSLLTGQIAGVARIPATQAPGVIRTGKGKKTARYSQYALVIKEGDREKTVPLTSEGVKSLVLYNLQGNKAALIARHSGLFYALGQRAVRLGGKFLDLFGGSGLVTRFLGEVGQLPPGSVLNEFVPARATLLSKSASEPEAVAAAATDIATRCLADANVKAFFEGWGGGSESVLNWLNDELNGKHSESPQGTYIEEGGSKLKDNAQVAALMLVAQRATSVSLSIKEAKPSGKASKTKGGKAAPYVSEGWALFDDNDRAPSLSMRGNTTALKTGLRELSDAKTAKNILTTYARVLTQAHVIQGDGFERAKGKGVAIRPGDTIYLDPPYINTQGYGTEAESAGLASPEVFEKKVSDVVDTLRGLGLLNCVTVAISNSYEVNPKKRSGNETKAQAIERARATAYDVYKRIARRATFEFKKEVGGKEVAFQIPLFSVGIGYRTEGSNALSDAASKERAAAERAAHPGAELYSTGTPRFDNEAFLVSDGGAYLMNPSAEDVADVVGQAAQADVVLSTADAVRVLEEARNAQFEASIDETAASRGLTEDEKKAVRDAMIADRDAYVADRKSRALVDRATRASVKTTKNLFERFCDTIRGWIGGVDVQVLSDEEFDAAVDQVENGGVGRFAVYNAFHGGSMRFKPTPDAPYGTFDTVFSGSGEGGAAFGPGIYLTLQPWVAERYADISLRRHTGDAISNRRVDAFVEAYARRSSEAYRLVPLGAFGHLKDEEFDAELKEVFIKCLRDLGLQGDVADYDHTQKYSRVEKLGHDLPDDVIVGMAIGRTLDFEVKPSETSLLYGLIDASRDTEDNFSFSKLGDVIDKLKRHAFLGPWPTHRFSVHDLAEEIYGTALLGPMNTVHGRLAKKTFAMQAAADAMDVIGRTLGDFFRSGAVWRAYTRAATALVPLLESETVPRAKKMLVEEYEKYPYARVPLLYNVSVDFGNNNENLLWYDAPIPANKKARILAVAKKFYDEQPALAGRADLRTIIKTLENGEVYFDDNHDEVVRAASVKSLFIATGNPLFVTTFLKMAGFVGHVYPIGSLHGYNRGVDLERGEGNFVIYNGRDIKINGRQSLYRKLRHPATGRVLGLYNMLEHKVYVREGADLSVLAHEVGWHATYNYARQHSRALYEKLRGIVRTALEGNPRLGEEIRKTYGRPVFVEGAGEYQYVMDEEEFIDEVGAALFEQESLQKLQGWVDNIENPSTRKKVIELIKRIWETICKIWCEAIGTYDKYWTKDGKKKVDLDKIVSEVSPLKALDELVDSFVKGEVLSELKELGGTNEARFDRLQGKRKASPYVGRRLEDLIRTTLGSKKAVTKDWPEEDVERFVREVGVLMNATDAGPKFLRALTMWQKIGTLDIVEDLYKCVEVARLLAHHPEIAPEAYLSPQELLNAYSDFRAHGFVSPDDYPALTNRREIGADVVVYDVDDSPEGQRQVREIMDSHLGRGSGHSPWCLLRADSNGLAPEAARWWRHYAGTGKRVAFYKGKICAFSASATSKVLWWDLCDNSSEDGNIPVNLSRGKVRYVNEYTGHSFLGNEQKSFDDGVRISVGNISVSRREVYREDGDDVFQRVTREYGRGTDHLLRVNMTHERRGNEPMRIVFRAVSTGDIAPEEDKLFQYGENVTEDRRGYRNYNVGAQQVEREPDEEHQDFDGYAYVKGPDTAHTAHASFSLRTREGAFVSQQSDFKARATRVSGVRVVEIKDKEFSASNNSNKGVLFLDLAGGGYSLNNRVLVPTATVGRFLGGGAHTDAQLAEVASWWIKAGEADRQGELSVVVQDMFAKTSAAHNAWEKPFVLIRLKRALPAHQSVGLLEEIYTAFETVVNAKADALLAPHANVRFSKEGEGGVSSEAAETLAYMKEVFGRMKEDIGQEARTAESTGPERAQEARQEQDTTFARYADIVQENAQVVLAAMLQNGKLLDSGDTNNGDRREMYVRALVPGASSLMVNDIIETASAAMDEVLAAEAKRGRQIIDRRGTTEQIYARIRDAEQAEAEYVAHSAVLSALQALMASRDDMQARSDIDKELAARDAQEETGRGVAERPALSDEELVALGGDTFTPNKEGQADDAFTMSVKAIIDKLEQTPPVALGTLRSTLYEHLRAKAGAIPDNRVAGRALSLLDSLMQDANTEKSVVAAAKKVERLIREVSPKDTIKSLKDKISRMLRPYRTVNPRTPEKDRPNLGLEAIFFSAFRKAIKTNVKVTDVEKRINDLGSLIAPSARAVGAKNSVGGLAEFSGDPDMLRLVQEREALVLAREYKLAAAKKTGDINRLYRVYQILGIRMQQGKNAFSNKMAEQERQASDFADTLSDAIYVEGRDKGSEYQGGTKKTLGALFTGTLSLKQQLLDATRFCKDKIVKGRANKAIAALNKKIADADMAAAARKQRDIAWFNREVCALWSTRKGILEKSDNAIAWEATSILTRLATPREEYAAFSASGKTALSYAQLLQIYSSIIQEDVTRPFDELEKLTGEARNEAFNALSPDARALYWRIQQRAEIEDAIGEEGMQFVADCSAKFVEDAHEVDEVAMDVAGVPMTMRTSNYFPIVRKGVRLRLNEPGDVLSYVPAFMTPRVTSMLDIDETADAFSVWLRRTTDAAHFVAFGRLHMFLGRVFGNARFAETYTATQGRAMTDQLVQHVRDILTPNLETSSARGYEAFASKLSSLAAHIAIGCNPLVMFRQMTSITAFAFDISWGRMFSAFIKAPASGEDVVERMSDIMNSEGWRARYKNDAEAIQLKMLSQRGKGVVLRGRGAVWWSRLMSAYMFSNKAGDMVPTLFVGQAIYGATKASLLSKINPETGNVYTNEEAKKAALSVTWDSIEKSQQTTRVANMAEWQRSRSALARLFGQFQSAPAQFLAAETAQLRAFVANPREEFWRTMGMLVNNHLVLPGLYTLAGCAYDAVVGPGDEDDDDGKWFWERDQLLTDFVVSSVLGPAAGIYLLGSVLSSIASMVQSQSRREATVPAFSIVSRAAYATQTLAKHAATGEGSTLEDARRFTEALVPISRTVGDLYDKFTQDEQ